MRSNDIEFNQLQEAAANGNPKAMYELALAYESNALPDSNDRYYIHWLRRFFATPEVQNILLDLESRDEADSHYAPSSMMDIEQNAELSEYIIEAGIALGLYYYNSTDISEIEYAQMCIYSAFLASRFAYIEVPMNEVMVDLVSLLSSISNRLKHAANDASNMEE